MLLTETLGNSSATVHTIWGLEPLALHDRFWASRGVQVARAGQRTQIDRKAELFLLIDPRELFLFDLQNWIELMNWTKPDLLLLRVHAKRNLGYREILTANNEGDFVRFERRYKVRQVISTRVGLTCERELAEAWQTARSVSNGWQQMRAAVPSTYRETRSSPARIYRRNIENETSQFVEDLVGIWKYPSATISRASKTASKAWADSTSEVNGHARIVGPVWVGAGRKLLNTGVVVGPAVLWDDPETRPVPDELQWANIEPTGSGDRLNIRRPLSSVYRTTKRLFDVLFSLMGLMLTLPFYPIVMLAIFLEDGSPCFFGHERETLEGRTFRCWKFRSMRKDAQQMTAEMLAMNQADGPQFFIENDPRITRVGRILRKSHLDEVPQFINVLLGQMSVVGPRPSPRGENRYCPEWREARLSVRPGITGLWQVRRTRLRGRDFQEWIKYDIEYVESMNWIVDIKLLWQTLAVVARRTVRS
ncbi:MAG TPA: sugar transferase [Tepidisphaeraceae bacterium]|jgi:lipopolysaccharide/colanic/teichoic acid biosynthesis glycosyltransferase|nr:sugar transferase [Tepidisphaeraceae bacterium]